MSEGYGISLFHKLVTDILNIFGLKKNLDEFEVFATPCLKFSFIKSYVNVLNHFQHLLPCVRFHEFSFISFCFFFFFFFFFWFAPLQFYFLYFDFLHLLSSCIELLS